MDILIYTEVDNRELDAACLIKTEMERRGYRVAIERYNRICDAGNMLIYRPKMLILPWLYDSNFLFNFINENNQGKLKLVNLQSEQVLSENFILNNYHMPKEKCKEGYHLAWGRETAKRFVNNGISEEHIIQAGNLNMDFNSKKFLTVYNTKNEMALEHNLDKEKKWVLFISSFTHPSMTEEERTRYLERFPFLKEFVDISIKSQEVLIKWFERFVKENDDYEFIYRPHPVELNNRKLVGLENKYKNFHVISQKSVRQWIFVCEYNLTWFSTSIADVYFQKKPCAILRPLAIPREADCELFYDCESLKEYEEFLDFIKSKQQNAFPIRDERFEKYYGTLECGMIYEEFCDRLEDILKSNEKMSNIELRCKWLSKIHRNMISFIFQLNKLVRMSGCPGVSRNRFMKEQLEEKWTNRKSYSIYKKRMCEVLRGVIEDV